MIIDCEELDKKGNAKFGLGNITPSDVLIDRRTIRKLIVQRQWRFLCIIYLAKKDTCQI